MDTLTNRYRSWVRGRFWRQSVWIMVGTIAERGRKHCWQRCKWWHPTTREPDASAPIHRAPGAIAGPARAKMRAWSVMTSGDTENACFGTRMIAWCFCWAFAQRGWQRNEQRDSIPYPNGRLPSARAERTPLLRALQVSRPKMKSYDCFLSICPRAAGPPRCWVLSHALTAAL